MRKYTIDLLTETCMLGCRHTDALIEFNVKLRDNTGDIDGEKYQQLVGKLIYLLLDYLQRTHGGSKQDFEVFKRNSW